MSDTTTAAPVGALRQRMIEDMSARLLNVATQRGYIRGCKRFAAFLKRSPDTATPQDVRLFQLHLVDEGTSIYTRNQTMVGLGFLFRVTLRRPDRRCNLLPARAEEGAADHEPGRSALPARRRHDAQSPAGLEHRLWLRSSCWRGGAAARLRHRQQPDDHPHRAGEGPQGPARHVVARHAGAAQGVLADALDTIR